jgi:hypothetical protein
MEHFIQNQTAITAGDRFKNDRYTVIKQLAKGGQAFVYLVADKTENDVE